MNILVADDDPMLRALLTMQLEKDGHKVTGACSGEEAYLFAGLYQPDLLVLDIMLPGIDGLEVLRKLRADEQSGHPHLPVVLVTGRDDDHDIAAGWASGADYYITKPFVIEHLRYFIDSLDQAGR